jgi:hypothetical protein
MSIEINWLYTILDYCMHIGSSIAVEARMSVIMMDSAISGKQKAGLCGRKLTKWETDGGEEFCELEVATKGIGKWDQFAANLKLFNVHATFDENEYTTKLDFALVDTVKQTHAEDLVSCSPIYPFSSHPYFFYSNLFQPIVGSLVDS